MLGTLLSVCTDNLVSAGMVAVLATVEFSTFKTPRGSALSASTPKYSLPITTGVSIWPSSKATQTTSPTL